MRRFFIDQQPTDGTVVITGPEAHHISHVLRMRPGDRVELFTGQGDLYSAVLRGVSGHRVVCAILSRADVSRPAGSGITLAQCCLKKKKMDLLVRMATELGVDRFVPVLSRFASLPGDHEVVRGRWQRIVTSACKQCGRNLPMEICPPLSITDLGSLPCSEKIMLWEGEPETVLAQEPPSESSTCLLTGPEGGFSPEDLHAARKIGFTSVSLGRTTLRAETASLAALSVILFLRGQLR